MDQKTKNNIFTGPELNKLQDFCKECAEEDRKIYEKRKSNQEIYTEPPQEPKEESYEPPKTNNDYNQYQYQANEKTSDSQYTYEEGGVKKNVLGEDDPFNARIKFDTFDKRLKQFGSNKK